MADFECATCHVDIDDAPAKVVETPVSDEDTMVVYSTGCPKCKIIENKLNLKNIRYKIVDDIDVIKSKGYMSVPVVEYKGNVYQFPEANALINQFGVNS